MRKKWRYREGRSQRGGVRNDGGKKDTKKVKRDNKAVSREKSALGNMICFHSRMNILRIMWQQCGFVKKNPL